MDSPSDCVIETSETRDNVSISNIRANGRNIWNQTRGGIPEGMALDHINGDSLDNSSENLRLVNIA